MNVVKDYNDAYSEYQRAYNKKAKAETKLCIKAQEVIKKKIGIEDDDIDIDKIEFIGRSDYTEYYFKYTSFATNSLNKIICLTDKELID